MPEVSTREAPTMQEPTTQTPRTQTPALADSTTYAPIFQEQVVLTESPVAHAQIALPTTQVPIPSPTAHAGYPAPTADPVPTTHPTTYASTPARAIPTESLTTQAPIALPPIL